METATDGLTRDGRAAAGIDEAEPAPGHEPAGFTRWNGAERYFWVEGCTDEGEGEYHWVADCWWLMTSLAHGGRLVVSDKAHPNAVEASADLRAAAGREGARWLCRLCECFEPRPVATPRDPVQRPCRTCGCPKHFHEGWCVGIFNSGCWNAWAEVSDGQVALLHCRCDGYVSPDGLVPEDDGAPPTCPRPAVSDTRPHVRRHEPPSPVRLGIIGDPGCPGCPDHGVMSDRPVHQEEERYCVALQGRDLHEPAGHLDTLYVLRRARGTDLDPTITGQVGSAIEASITLDFLERQTFEVPEVARIIEVLQARFPDACVHAWRVTPMNHPHIAGDVHWDADLEALVRCPAAHASPEWRPCQTCARDRGVPVRSDGDAAAWVGGLYVDHDGPEIVDGVWHAFDETAVPDALLVRGSDVER